MALTSRAAFVQCMRVLVQERIGSVKDKMAFGGGVISFEAYREMVGEARGLADALELIDEAERQVEERERGH